MKQLLIIITLFTMSLTNAQESIYNININSINGETINLEQYRGKYILFVNVASKCGFTPQYKELEKLFQLYKEQLIVIGIPCNQFGGQEPATEKEIITFCEDNYGVSFLLTEKIHVKGSEQHPLYNWLCSKEKNGKSNSTVQWNFQKYLVNTSGELIDYYYSTTNPMSQKITKHIK